MLTCDVLHVNDLQQGISVASNKNKAHVRPTDSWVVAAIKDLILDRGLQSGDMLPSEAELTEILEISRSSVREAIKVLSTLDIVEVRHGTGTYVSNMSLQPMVQSLIFRGTLTPSGGLMAFGDIVEIREKLDIAYAQEVVKKMAHSPQTELHALVDRMEKMAKKGDMCLEADREFHKLIAKKANNLFLLQLVDAFWDVEAVVFPKLGALGKEEALANAHMHRDLLEAAETGNTARYKKLVSEHYKPLKRLLPHPNYFPDENNK